MIIVIRSDYDNYNYNQMITILNVQINDNYNKYTNKYTTNYTNE